MNKQELTIAKKIAEIECLDTKICELDGVTFLAHIKPCWTEYNPFDWSVLGLLMLKYVVSINSRDRFVEINTDKIECWVDFSAKEGIPHAILECIIKSKEG